MLRMVPLPRFAGEEFPLLHIMTETLGRSRIRTGWPVALLAAPLILFLAIIYVWPVGSLLTASVTEPSWGDQNFRQLVASGIYGHVFWLTFKLSFIVTAATLLLAYPVAYYLTVTSSRVGLWLMFLILVPSWTSVLVRSFGWMILLGRHGVVNALLSRTHLTEQPLQLMFNTGTVEVAMIAILLPFMILPLYSAMRAIDPTLVPASRGLGANPLQAFWRIYLPLSRPGIVTGTSIVFVLSLGFFITPALLGGTRDITVAMLILQQFDALLNWGFGAALSAVLLAVALLALVLFGWLLRQNPGMQGRT